MNNLSEKMKKILSVLDKYKRYIGVCALFVVMVLVLYFFTGEQYVADRLAEENSKPVSGEDYVPDKEFDVNEYAELNELIALYFDAYVNADFETLETIVTPISDMEKSYITTMSEFYEEYQNIKCYSKRGLSKDSYIVSACFDIKFADQEVVAPSMVLFYVQTNEEGELYINNLYSDFNMQYAELAINRDVYTALLKYTTQADYLTLYNEVETAFNQLIRANEDIYVLTKRTIPAIRQEWEDNVYYSHGEDTENTEGTESTEGTETTEGTESTEGTEDAGGTETQQPMA